MGSTKAIIDQLRWLRSLHELTASVDLVAFEEHSPAQVRESLLPLANKVLRIALDVFERLSRAYDSVTEPDRGRPLRSSELRQEIADLCFIARMELTPRVAEVANPADPEDKWSVLSASSHAFGCIAKAIFALEPRLAALAGEEPSLKRTSSVDQAVRVRRVYHNFYERVILDGPPEPLTAVARLREASAAIERLVSSAVYPQMRGSDRCQLRRLEERVRAWLADESASASSGIEIWQDLAALAAIFQQINRRQDLIDHDRAVLSELSRALAELDPTMRPRPTLVQRLGAVVGRDEELDTLLENPERTSCGRLAAVIDRVLSELAGEPAPAAAFV